MYVEEILVISKKQLSAIIQTLNTNKSVEEVSMILHLPYDKCWMVKWMLLTITRGMIEQKKSVETISKDTGLSVRYIEGYIKYLDRKRFDITLDDYEDREWTLHNEEIPYTDIWSKYLYDVILK